MEKAGEINSRRMAKKSLRKSADILYDKACPGKPGWFWVLLAESKLHRIGERL